MPVPTDEQVKLIRDAYLECYVRRNPQAQPEPGTSLYAVLEATAGLLAAIMASIGPDAEKAVVEFLEHDRQAVIQPAPDPAAYLRLEEVVERASTGEVVETQPNPEREELGPTEADQWPCVRNAEGSF